MHECSWIRNNTGFNDVLEALLVDNFTWSRGGFDSYSLMGYFEMRGICWFRVSPTGLIYCDVCSSSSEVPPYTGFRIHDVDIKWRFGEPGWAKKIKEEFHE